MADLETLEALIAAHQASWEALEAACKVTDDAFGDEDEAAAAAEAFQAAASDATFQAVWNIVEHPYSTLEEVKRGMAYLVEHHRLTGDGDPEAWFRGFVEHLTGIAQEEAA